MKKPVKILIEILLAILAVLLVWALYASIMEPVNFEKEQKSREEVGIQRLKDIRTLEVAFKSVNGHFTADIDSLKNFYNNGKMDVVMQIGSQDDSVAVANTAELRKKNKKITNEELLALSRKGLPLVFSITTPIAVKDTLFNGREDFCVDSLSYIPFSGGKKVLTDAIVKKVSGVDVPLFEAKMPYDDLLKGMDRQLVVNLKDNCDKSNRYQGLQVGSVSAPNNNAGNWE